MFNSLATSDYGQQLPFARHMKPARAKFLVGDYRPGTVIPGITAKVALAAQVVVPTQLIVIQ
jgi:hypothetical protein